MNLVMFIFISNGRERLESIWKVHRVYSLVRVVRLVETLCVTEVKRALIGRGQWPAYWFAAPSSSIGWCWPSIVTSCETIWPHAKWYGNARGKSIEQNIRLFIYAGMEEKVLSLKIVEV